MRDRMMTAQFGADTDRDIARYGDDESLLVLATRAPLTQVVEARIRAFLGNGPLTHEQMEVPRYYGNLLAWAVERHRCRDGWEVVGATDSMDYPAEYGPVNTGPNRWERAMFHGIMLLSRGHERLVASIRVRPDEAEAVILSSQQDRGLLEQFQVGIVHIFNCENPYKGQNVQFGEVLSFLDVSEKRWSDLVLAPGITEEVVAHSVGFLGQTEALAKYGIAPRRGILLTGRPGTGKTLICKVLMNASPGITCVAAHCSGLVHPRYIEELYEVARDTSPSIVFLEDIDLIGQGRQESGYQRGQALAQLLFELDGLEDCRNVVTIATTNWLDILDEALKDRPSRFDRVVAFDPPGYEERISYIDLLAQTIPIPQPMRERLAKQSEGLTPAQIQEAVHGVVIEAGVDNFDSAGWEGVFSPDTVDTAVAGVRRKAGKLGFKADIRSSGR